MDGGIIIKKLVREFYNQDTLTLSKELIGKYMVHIVDGERLVSRITETEAYLGPVDKASHAYEWKRTARTEAMFKEGGHAYVYLIYGMYNCMNVVAEKEGMPCAVLIRGLKAVEGIDEISVRRYGKKYDSLTKSQIKNMLNGPGKLCIGMGITRDNNYEDLLGDSFFICEEEGEAKPEIGVGKRINIDYAEEDVDKMWRFFELEEKN